MKPIKLSLFEEEIGYTFQNRNTLLLAFTHSSYANEQKGSKKENNERLEYLGDAVLELTVSDYLYRSYPERAEGELTKLRAALVCEFSLAACARQLNIGRFLILSKGEDMTGGRERDSILSDTFEAIIGAIYLDGGLEAAKAFIHEQVLTDIDTKKLFYDSKTILQERIQQQGKGDLKYRLLSEEGPDHNKLFTVEVVIDGKTYAKGTGRKKQAAEQVAAYETLRLLNI